MTKSLRKQELALAFLAHQQQADGSFLTFSSADPNDFSSALTFHSTFTSALLLQVCSKLPSTTARKIGQSLASFLLKQKSSDWTWNYWNRQSEEAKTLPYPDDLDDTFCAAAALQSFAPQNVDTQALSALVKLLTFCEEKEGGPYRTWVVRRDAKKVWRDVDLAVNANIAFFLQRQGVTLPHLQTLFEKAVLAQRFTSPYYPSVYSVIYFLSRSYHGPSAEQLRSYLWQLAQPSGHWPTPLQTALAVSSLLVLGEKKEQLQVAVNFLYTTQHADGSWPIEAFYTGVNPQRDKQFFAGSASLTTALCLEAVIAFDQLSQTMSQTKPESSDKADPEYQQVVKLATARIAKLAQPLQTIAEQQLALIQEIDRDQHILLLPFVFAKQMKHRVSAAKIRQLCVANLFGWLAYTIYDDVWDNEDEPAQLGCANVALRYLTETYQKLSAHHPAIFKLFNQVMDELDWANTWEVSYCRPKITQGQIDLKTWRPPQFGKYHVIAAKSMGHALGPLSILLLNGVTIDSPQLQKLHVFFEHYIIARQLNDDAHDVFKDLSRGQITAVNTLLIRDWQREHKETTLTLNDPQLKPLFWGTTINKVAKIILSECRKAHQLSDILEGILHPSFVKALLSPLEKATHQALAEQKATQRFLKQYLKS